MSKFMNYVVVKSRLFVTVERNDFFALQLIALNAESGWPLVDLLARLISSPVDLLARRSARPSICSPVDLLARRSARPSICSLVRSARSSICSPVDLLALRSARPSICSLVHSVRSSICSLVDLLARRSARSFDHYFFLLARVRHVFSSRGEKHCVLEIKEAMDAIVSIDRQLAYSNSPSDGLKRTIGERANEWNELASDMFLSLSAFKL